MDAFKTFLTPGANPSNSNEPGFMLTTLTKGVASLAGLVGIVCGIFTILSIHFTCIFAGGLIALEGLIVTLIEAPCFCVFLDFSQIPSSFFDKKPLWTRATLYLLFAVLPFFFCSGVAEFFACGLYLITSALYLMQSLGKKASLDEMRAAAAQQVSSAPTAVLVSNEQPMPTSKVPPSAGFFGQATIPANGNSGLTGVVY